MNIAHKQNVATFNGADLPQQHQQRCNEQPGSKSFGPNQHHHQLRQALKSGWNGNNLTHMYENIFTSAVVAVIGENLMRQRWANKKPEKVE